MNVETGKIIKATPEQFDKMPARERGPLVPLPDDPILIEKASTMTRRQRRRYKTLVERRGRPLEEALAEALEI